MSGLLARLGLDEGRLPPEPLAERLRQSGERALRMWGTAPGLVPELELPAPTLEVLRAAAILELEQGRPEAAEALLAHVLDHVPTLLVMQLGSSDAVAEQVFWRPHPMGSWAHLGPALSRFSALLERAELGHSPVARRVLTMRRGPTRLGELYPQLYFGRSQPMLGAYPDAMARWGEEMEASQEPEQVLDRRLAAVLLHELSHFDDGREALFPYLDEALAGYLGLHLLQETAFSAPGEDNALFGWPWFTQVGQAVARLFGLEAMVRAQAGAIGWEELLGEQLVSLMERLWWQDYSQRRDVSFHPDTTRPGRWIKLMELVAAGIDMGGYGFETLDALKPGDHIEPGPARSEELEREAIRHALLSATLCADAHWRVTCQPGASVVLDLAGCQTLPRRPSAIPHALPARWCARLRARGASRIELDLHELEAVEELTERLRLGELEGARGAAGCALRVVR